MYYLIFDRCFYSNKNWRKELMLHRQQYLVDERGKRQPSEAIPFKQDVSKIRCDVYRS